MVVFNANSVVKYLIQDNQWIWLNEWLQKYVVLQTINPIHLIDTDDRLCWQSIHPRSTTLDWFNFVRFSQSVPRHACFVWLGEHLKTQGILKSWEVVPMVNIEDMCCLCKLVQDTHCHLLF